ncbi:hypothetical protein [Nannocystis radixulma]|uniref:Uncharacterized protein n=1 Tax=Nannocystis radixulma TaxID=2995305 RepID=A0ABT5BFA3_9BACT|nr:hypothetical protein [Nannocystis radixulma]MDC0672113.1 hypothetical protein [Nannocystis radixulma]
MLVLLPLLAFLLGLPSLAGGLALDDLLLREHLDDATRGVTSLYDFGGPAEVVERRASGAFPWWTADDLQVRFFRPLTAATLAVDGYGAPWWMHLHSVLWFVLLVFVVGRAYRTLAADHGARPWIAGLALLLFAVDDAHAASVGWIAARHGLIGAVFGVLALLAHHHWRARGWTGGVVAGPGALALGLLASESALACLGYLAAYALVLERAEGWRARMRTLVPYALVVVAWYAAYRALGHGAQGCGMYVDPAVDPLVFAVSALLHVPLLLMAQLGLPAVVELLVFVPGALVPAAFVAWFGLLVCASIVRPLLRSCAVARFWAFGMVLAALPLGGTLPADRHLLLVGVGACGLVAATIAALGEEVRARRMVRLLAWIWIVLHGLFAVLLIVPRMLGPAAMQRTIAEAVGALPDPSDRRPIVLVQAPGDVFTLYAPAIRGAGGLHVLYAGVGAVALERRDPSSLVLRPAGGWLAAPGDRIFRAGRPMHPGDAIVLPEFVMTVLEVAPDGRPAVVLLRADFPLDAGALRWMAWADGKPTPLELPRVGESRTLAPASWRFD